MKLNSVIWKSNAGRERLNLWYDRFADQISTPVTRGDVETRLGNSHVLIGGPADGIPIVCLHAMRTGAPFLLSQLGPLLERYRIYAPDLPSQSVRGPQNAISLQDDSLALWLFEIMDHFELQCVNLFGVSWGGFVARLAASTAPARINRLVMMVPAGIANGSHITGILKMAFPMLRYRLRPSTENLKKLLAPILTTWDQDWADYIACTIRDMKIDTKIPPLASDTDLKRLTMPTLVLVAEHDISFPGRSVIARLKQNVSNVEIEIIPESKHCPPTTAEFQNWLGQRLTAFLDDNPSGMG